MANPPSPPGNPPHGDSREPVDCHELRVTATRRKQRPLRLRQVSALTHSLGCPHAHTRMHTHRYNGRTHANMHIYAQFAHTRGYICVHTQMHTYTRVCACTHMDVYTWVYCMHTHAHRCSPTYSHADTHARAQRASVFPVL